MLRQPLDVGTPVHLPNLYLKHRRPLAVLAQGILCGHVARSRSAHQPVLHHALAPVLIRHPQLCREFESSEASVHLSALCQRACAHELDHPRYDCVDRCHIPVCMRVFEPIITALPKNGVILHVHRACEQPQCNNLRLLQARLDRLFVPKKLTQSNRLPARPSRVRLALHGVVDKLPLERGLGPDTPVVFCDKLLVAILH
mmetsp:Transcript_1128/g.2653  ORF Transcript_1128/g.2653 Transcript_1128/m.2653 type:complete len:200 (-) Transcript_1128:420-1019(-)